jgi:zinc/manganese transport system substrate-binding protein
MKILTALIVASLAPVLTLQAELKVASLSTITTDIAQNVGGDSVEIFAMVKPGVDPHEFQPTPGDIQQISSSDLVLYTGRHIEGYMTKLQETVGGDVKFIDTGAAIDPLPMGEEGEHHEGEAHSHSHGHDHGDATEDPHWWHSIANVKKATLAVRDAFIAADPANKATYEKNAAAYEAELTDLQDWATEKVAELPRNQRKLVTSHDAFQYLAHDYDFTVHPVQGVSTADEPSSKKVAALIDLIKAQGVKAIFAENIENPKVLTEITSETGATLGGELYADGLGTTEAATYPEMVKHNVTTIVEGLK